MNVDVLLNGEWRLMGPAYKALLWGTMTSPTGQLSTKRFKGRGRGSGRIPETPSLEQGALPGPLRPESHRGVFYAAPPDFPGGQTTSSLLGRAQEGKR